MRCFQCQFGKGKLCQQHASLRHYNDIFKGLNSEEKMALYKKRVKAAFETGKLKEFSQ